MNSGLGAILAVLVLASCRSTEVTRTRSVAPGGDYAATATLKDCGAGCSPSGYVTLHDLKNRIGEGDIKVFDGNSGWPLEVLWTGPASMVVIFCDANHYEAKNRLSESMVEGTRRRSVTVTVVTTREPVIGGKRYCQ